MTIAPSLRRILYAVAELAHNDIHTSVIDSAISRETRVPDFEVRSLLNELGELGLIKILTKPTGVNFRLINLTSAGLQEIISN